MLIDVIIVVLTVAMGIWGYSRGVSTGILVAVGFGVGALLGSRLGPQVLSGGLHDPFAPVLAVPGALLLGAALAAAMERVGFKLRGLLRRRYTLDAFGGAVLAGLLGVVLIWVIAAAAMRIDGLEGTARESGIVVRLDSVLPAPGPILAANDSSSDSRPPGSRARETRAELRVKQDPQVRAAAASVVKIAVTKCTDRGSASGWIAADGIVMTNAHVTHGSTRVRVRLEGKGVALDAQPIYYNEAEDISILRVPAAKGERALRINPRPDTRFPVAVLGFPFGQRFKVRAAQLGGTVPLPPGTEVGRPGRPARALRSGLGLGPGVSGGPVVDRRGRVVAMIFAGQLLDRRRNQLGVPSPVMQTALRRALSSPRVVDTGGCH